MGSATLTVRLLSVAPGGGRQRRRGSRRGLARRAKAGAPGVGVLALGTFLLAGAEQRPWRRPWPAWPEYRGRPWLAVVGGRQERASRSGVGRIGLPVGRAPILAVATKPTALPVVLGMALALAWRYRGVAGRVGRRELLGAGVAGWWRGLSSTPACWGAPSTSRWASMAHFWPRTLGTACRSTCGGTGRGRSGRSGTPTTTPCAGR